MEDIKPLTPSPSDSRTSSGDVDIIEARFKDFCKNGLALDDNTQIQATKILRGTKQQLVSNMSSIGSGSAEEAERFWFAFVLYSVKRLSESTTDAAELKSNDNGYTLCQVLRTAKLNIVDFFKELPQFVVRAAAVLSNMYGKDWESRLEAKELQATFVHLSVLSKHYKRTYWEYFLLNDSDVNGHSDDANLTCYLSDCYRFGWLLFLAVRIHALSSFKDLLTCTNGLVSILAILIIHIPARFRKFNIHDSSLFVKKDDKGVDLIASLCKIYSVPEEELRRTLIKANKLVEDILKKSPQAASDCKIETLENIDTDGLIYFEDLFEPSSLSSSINLLEKDYDDALHKKGELDERLFLNENDSMLASSSLSGGSINIIGAKRKFDSISSPTRTITGPLSPHRSSLSHANGATVSNSKVAATPLSTAMTTAKWLRTVISPLPSKPSAELQKFFALRDRDVTSDVVRRAHIIMEAVFPSSALGERCVSGNLQGANLMDKIWAEQRRIEAIKLYYRVLETMCRAESQVSNGNNLTSLIINERFHRCMLACSAELVLATHKTVTMLFPAVLERTGITAYDLSKVIEGFIRHEESLPRELRRHLNSLEEKLLESMVWEKKSSMYNTLAVAKPALAGEINRLGLLAEPMPSLDAIAMRINYSCGGLTSFPPSLKQETLQGKAGNLISPKRVRSEYRSALIERNSIASPGKDRLLAPGNLRSKVQPPLQSAFASPTKPCPGSGGETYAQTGVRILFSKIIKLAAVRISGLVERLQLSQQTRESVYCLFQKVLNQRTSLFFNRHIDQLILCCFYGVAKISQLQLTFREIICTYRKQPQCKPQVFRSVFVDWSLSCRSGKAGHDHVDIITFYNEFFIPSVKPLLVEFSPQGMSSKTTLGSDAKSSNDGPGSPNVSPFPKLPDMSPKKVSAQHNVYVSPLRSSKMDVLVSHSSKSYYACVGESTHAYQSPSKDLTAINNCLNRASGSTRKLRGTLNFDDADVGLPVSDSVVANSLYPQNGSSPRSSTVPSKPEQAER